MNRTRKLMSSVTASVLLAGPLANDIVSLAEGAATQGRKAPEQSAEIDKAADAVCAFLRAKCLEADRSGVTAVWMSLDDILKELTSLKRETAQKALDLLCYQGKVKKGDPKENPEKYAARLGEGG